MAARVLADVNVIDKAVWGCRETIWYASRQARLLFPPAMELLDALACAALAHVARFEYRLDFGDLDEASFLADQVLTLGQEGQLDVAPWVRAVMALARADLWRYRVLGDPELAAMAVTHIDGAAGTQDPLVEALLAECLHARAETLADDQALDDLARASDVLDRLLDPDYPIPSLKVLPWLEAGWAATWCLVELDRFNITGDQQRLSRAMHLGHQAVYHVRPSTAEAEYAHLAALLIYFDEHGSASEVGSVEAHLDIAIAAGSGRYWYALMSALTFAEWSLPRGWSQPATTSARVAYDIIDQAVSHQAGENHRRHWIPWLARATSLAVPALAAAGAPGPAASRLEQARVRILAERFYDDISELNELPSDLHGAVADTLARNLRVLRDPAASRTTRNDARDSVLRATEQVRQRPGFEFFRWKLEPDNLLHTAGDSTIVYLTPGEPHGVAILGGGRLGPWRSVPLPDCGPLPQQIGRFIDTALCADAPAGARRKAIEPVTQWLGRAVWEPVADELNDVNELWLVPCGYLALLPCHAGRLDSLGFDFALRRWDIRYAVNARSLARARQLPAPQLQPQFLAISQPIGQERLVGADAEVRAVAQWFIDGRVLDPEQANAPDALEGLRYAGYLHAACHGVADPDQPLLSGLELGDGGRLTLRDLSGVRTGLEIGVLSACETNVPDPESPDEAMSLAVGLHLTGCRGVIASSWRVPDSATLALMDGLYRNWRGPDSSDPPEALRQAQLQLAEDTRWHEPYYWAGFSFLGASLTDSSRSPSPAST
jgi:hypothetical protein